MSDWDVFVTHHEPPKVCLRVDNQIFSLSAEYEEDEPERLNWYVKMLAKAMEKASPGNRKLTTGCFGDPVHPDMKSDWQPIETAPKDGRDIVAAWEKLEVDDDEQPTDVVIGYAKAVTNWNGGWIEPEFLNAMGTYFGDDFEIADKPSLWHPLDEL